MCDYAALASSASAENDDHDDSDDDDDDGVACARDFLPVYRDQKILTEFV